MLDFHSHVLPYLDDGSKNFDMSLDMLKTASDEGTKYICATPHFIPGEIEIGREAYTSKIVGLQRLCEINNININIISGLEVYLNPDMSRLYLDKKIWGINNTRYMLIELPMEQFPVYTENVFYELRLQGVVPVIAHPERNLRIIENINLLINLVDQGALVQLNSGSITGLYGKKVKEFSEELIKRNLVHVIGSDAHNNTSRSPKIKNVYNYIKSKNPNIYHWLLENEIKILNGEYVEPLHYIGNKKNKSIFSFLKLK